MATASGIILVDKPAGPTSHDVVLELRKRLGVPDIGHAGTLDPPATGLLVMAVGKATSVLQFCEWDKGYRGVIRLGSETDTLDATGRVLSKKPVTCTADQAAAAARALVGVRVQKPPMVSAVKVGGKRLHTLARKGKVVERPTREITVSRLEVVKVALPDIEVDLDCSSGTYVRVLATDVGAALKCGAHLASLRRTRVGPFDVKDAVAPRLATVAHLRSPVEALQLIPTRDLTPGELDAVKRGRSIRWTGTGLVRMQAEGKLWAVSEGDGKIAKPRRVFPEGL